MNRQAFPAFDIPREIVSVHRKPPSDAMPAFHRNYGLWIFASGMGGISPVGHPAAYPNRYFEFYCLSQMYDGMGKLMIQNGVECDIAPGDCVVIRPGTIHWYGPAADSAYCEDTVNFFGPVADMLMRAGVLTDGLLHAGPVRRLLPIIEFARNPDVDSQLRANIELQKLLVDLYLEKRMDHADYPTFDKLLIEIRDHLDKRWTVQEMAERCSLSEDQFRRIFLKTTGSTPKQYLDRLKLKRAAELLRSTDRKIPDIANSLGFPDVFHFSRRFKEVHGISPGRCRSGVSPDGPLKS